MPIGSQSLSASQTVRRESRKPPTPATSKDHPVQPSGFANSPCFPLHLSTPMTSYSIPSAPSSAPDDVPGQVNSFRESPPTVMYNGPSTTMHSIPSPLVSTINLEKRSAQYIPSPHPSLDEHTHTSVCGSSCKAPREQHASPSPPPDLPRNITASREVPPAEPSTKDRTSRKVGSTANGKGSQKRENKKNDYAGRKSGSPNYKAEEIDNLLEIVEDIEPLGANEWALVAEKYNAIAMKGEMPAKDGEALKKKFEKLAATKKKTGDPNCPPVVRRAKHISRSMLSRANAVVVGASDSSDGEVGDRSEGPVQVSSEEGAGDVLGAKRKRTNYVGMRKRAATPGAAGLRRGTDADPVVAVVSDMSNSVKLLCETLAKDTGDANDLRQELVLTNQRIDKMGVETNGKLDELKQLMLQALRR